MYASVLKWSFFEDAPAGAVLLLFILLYELYLIAALAWLLYRVRRGRGGSIVLALVPCRRKIICRVILEVEDESNDGG